MAFRVEVLDDFPNDAARVVAAALPATGSVVLTGGSSAESVYRPLARAGADWSDIAVYFSDERCVPPDDEASNYGMAEQTLLVPAGIERVHRMEGELPPDTAADRYHMAIAPAVTRGFDLLLLGMGADNHICALFPGSGALRITSSLCTVVDRPDGLTGLTLTPPALLAAKKVLLLVSGESKANAVTRALDTDATVDDCPVRLLADHPDATFLLDEAAASRNS